MAIASLPSVTRLAGTAAMLALIAHLRAQRHEPAGPAQMRGLTVRYPLPGSIFPPDMVAPTFLWSRSKLDRVRPCASL